MVDFEYANTYWDFFWSLFEINPLSASVALI